jgi:hypothetical protein
MFEGHSPCVHMISFQLTLYYLHMSECCDVVVFFLLIPNVLDSGLGSATGYRNSDLSYFLLFCPQKC